MNATCKCTLMILAICSHIACTSTVDPASTAGIDIVHVLRSVPLSDDLVTALDEMHQSHATCAFRSDYVARVAHPIAEWPVIIGEPNAYCIRGLQLREIAADRVEELHIVSLIYLGRFPGPRRRMEEIAVFASLVDGTWRLTWPAGGAGDLHPVPN